jgi:hypothetical protein
MEASMNSIIRLVAVVGGLVLILNVTPSWGQILVNPTVSDANLNTAGGTGALSKVDETPGPVGGTANAAFGFDALFNHTTGHFNTASGLAALYNNTTGQANTASGEGAAYLNTTGERNTAVGRHE